MFRHCENGPQGDGTQGLVGSGGVSGLTGILKIIRKFDVFIVDDLILNEAYLELGNNLRMGLQCNFVYMCK